MDKIQLGSTVRDIVTGFKGMVVSEIKYLSGCLQYGVKAKVGKDGKVSEVEYIDVGQLEVIEPEKKEAETSDEDPGGIMPDAPKKSRKEV